MSPFSDPWTLLLAIVAVGALLVVMPVVRHTYRRYREPLVLTCPETGQRSMVIVDAKLAAYTAAVGAIEPCFGPAQQSPHPAAPAASSAPAGLSHAPGPRRRRLGLHETPELWDRADRPGTAATAGPFARSGGHDLRAVVTSPSWCPRDRPGSVQSRCGRSRPAHPAERPASRGGRRHRLNPGLCAARARAPAGPARSLAGPGGGESPHTSAAVCEGDPR
jgi:hypothetical protein